VASIYKLLAFACRYGHQSLREMMVTPMPVLRRFVAATDDMIGEENGPTARD